MSESDREIRSESPERKRLERIPFYEYFHGDNGAGLGASHQTGWTALVATLAQMYGTVEARAAVGSGTESMARHPR